MPKKGKGHANETRKSERHHIRTPKDIAKASARQKSTTAKTTATPTATPTKKLNAAETLQKRAAFAQAHQRARVMKTTEWKDEESALVAKYGKFGYHYAKTCYQTLLARGTLARKAGSGRPRKYSDALVVDKIRVARNDANAADCTPTRWSSRKMAAVLSKDATMEGKLESPSRCTIARTKKRLGFKRIQRRKKPLANATTRSQRELFAMEHDGMCFDHMVVLDEKIFTENKKKNQEIEARQCSPLQPWQLYYTMAAETQTQLKKKMFLVGVTEGKKVGYYEVDCTDESNITKKGVHAKGMSAAYFTKLAKQLYDDARKIYPTGDLGVWMDLARAHTGAKAELEDIFKLGVISQPPRSPDFNLLDAGIFSYLERRQQEEGAVDLDEIRQSVKVAFDELTDLTVTKVCNAVRANFKVTMKHQGGNWYVEHRNKERVREEECCRCRATYTGPGPSALNLCDWRGCML